MKLAQQGPFFASGSDTKVALPVTPRPISILQAEAKAAEIVLVDELPLRRASVLSLLTTGVGAQGRSCGSLAEALSRLPAQRETLLGVVVYKDGRAVLETSFLEELRSLCRALHRVPVIVLSDCEEPEAVIAAFDCGVRGYIPTSLEPKLVIGAVELTLSGSTYLPVGAMMRWRRYGKARPTRQDHLPEAMSSVRWPPRELAVLRHLVLGKANKEIAQALMIEVSTVKVHIRHITRKMGVANRTQAALRARRMGIGGACEAEAGVPDQGGRIDDNQAGSGFCNDARGARVVAGPIAAYTSG